MQKPTEADWILKAMVAVAAADGRLNAPEVGLIQKVYQELTGRSVAALRISEIHFEAILEGAGANSR